MGFPPKLSPQKKISTMREIARQPSLFISKQITTTSHSPSISRVLTMVITYNQSTYNGRNFNGTKLYLG